MEEAYVSTKIFVDKKKLSTNFFVICNPMCDKLLRLSFQYNGKCYGDAIFIMSPSNDTISLCGHRDGLALRLEGYQDNLMVAFKSLDKSSGAGFACRLKMESEEKSENGFQGVRVVDIFI